MSIHVIIDIVIDSCTRVAWVEVIEDIKSISVMFATLHCFNHIVDKFDIKFAEVLAKLPELGKLNKREISSLCGLAPKTQQSGKKTFVAHIRVGRFAVRKALYMCALVASRFCPRLKEKYGTLLAKGKSKKVALVALMHTIIVRLNAMLKNRKV